MPGADAPMPFIQTPGYYSSDSSSSSSSSDEDLEMEVETRHRKGSHKRHSKRKGKKLKKLAKKRNKIARKIEKTASKHRRLSRKIARLQQKEARINRMLHEEQMKSERQGPPPANQPGHDPNPNRGPRRHWPFQPQGPANWPFQAPYPAGPAPAAPQPNGGEEYSQQLALLMEMGFTDAVVCKRLLKETKGDIKSVIVMMSLSKNATKPTRE